MDYQIINSDQMATLQGMVKQQIREGWRPEGGLAVVPSEPPATPSGPRTLPYRFFQAMTRQGKEVFAE